MVFSGVPNFSDGRTLGVDALIIGMMKAKGNQVTFLPNLRGTIGPFFSIRDTLILAYWAAYRGEGEKNLGETIDRWADCARFSAKAADSLGSLLDRLPKNTDDLDKRLLLINPLRLLSRTIAPEIDEEVRLQQAKDDATMLVGTKTLLEKIGQASKSRRDTLAKSRKNPGEVAKVEFAVRIAKWWLRMTGQVPGSGTEAQSNPFARFVATAWEDVFQEADVNFSRASRRAVNELKVEIETGRFHAMSL